MFKNPKHEHPDPLADITDADIAAYAPTPGPEVGKNAAEWLQRLVIGGIVAAIAVGGGKSIANAIHTNPHNGDRNPPRANS